jgi:hypothetical protein
MKARRKSKRLPRVKVEVDVLLRFPEGGGRVTAKISGPVVSHVKKALAEAGGYDVRGLWVHDDLPRGVDRRGAIALVLEALDPSVQDDPSLFMERAIEIAKRMKSDG